MILFAPFKDEYLSAVLRLIDRSDSTNRSAATWNGNSMRAVLTFDNEELIGVLPLEKRSFGLGGDRFLDILWVSGAHVEPEYRSQGVGTDMDRKIREYYFPECQGVFVYRGDETSRAYKWYRNLGYHECLPVLSLRNGVKRTSTTTEYMLMETPAEIQPWEDKLHNCFERCMGTSGGFPRRHCQFWSDKVKSHYYKEFYVYSILALTRRDQILGYAFLGQTAMKSGTPRIDILEFVAPDDDIVRDYLYSAVVEFACELGLDEIHLQLSAQDCHLPWMRSVGFVTRRRLNVMGKIIDPIGYFRDCLSEKLDLQKDYRFIVQTPVLGEHSVGTGKSSITLFATDAVFSQILLCRCNISNAIEEGRLVIVDGNETNINALGDIFPLYRWQYFHVDYV